MNIGACKVFLVVVFNLLGVGLLLISQNTSTVVRHLAAGKAVLSEDSEAAKTFAEPPVPTHIKFYFFDLQNLDEVNGGGIPVVEQKGPYAFKVTSTKKISWNDTKITYTPRKTYVFDPDHSNGSLSDTITTLNPGAMVLVGMGAGPQIKKIFDTGTIEEFLFEGIENSGFKAGYFQDKNGTSEGHFQACTGEDNIEDLNRIVSYEKDMDIEGADDTEDDSETFSGHLFTEEAQTKLRCEAFRGTNGERFAPFSVPPPKMSLYSPQLCRPWDLHYTKTVNHNGLDCVRFSSGADFFSRTFNQTLDTCLEENTAERDRGIHGIYDSSECQQQNAKILYSLPHFLNADRELLNDVKGLEPNASDHGFYLDVFPALGFVLDMRIRVQVNYRLTPHGNVSAIKETIYPVFWQEQMLTKENSDEAASIVYKKVRLPERAMYWISLSLGALFVLAAEIILLSGACSRKPSDSYTADDAYVTYSSRNGRSRVNMR